MLVSYCGDPDRCWLLMFVSLKIVTCVCWCHSGGTQTDVNIHCQHQSAVSLWGPHNIRTPAETRQTTKTNGFSCSWPFYELRYFLGYLWSWWLLIFKYISFTSFLCRWRGFVCNLVKEENAFRLSANLKSRLLTDIRVSEISNKYQRREELIWLPKDNVCFWRYNIYV